MPGCGFGSCVGRVAFNPLPGFTTTTVVASGSKYFDTGSRRRLFASVSVVVSSDVMG